MGMQTGGDRGASCNHGGNMKTKGKMSLVLVAVVAMALAAPAAFAEDGSVKTIDIPASVVELYEEHGIEKSTLAKSYGDLTWEEHVALRALEDDEDIDPVLNGAIHMALSKELTDEMDGVRTMIAGSWYTNTHPEEDE